MIYKVIKEYKVDNDIIRAGETICSSDCVLEADSFLLENGFIEEVKEDKRWREDKNGKYFAVDGEGDVMEYFECNHYVDNFRYLTGNYFKTQEEAQSYKGKLIATQRLTDIINEKNGDWVADWENVEERKYSIGEHVIDFTFILKTFSLLPYIKSQEICEEIIRDHKDLLDAINK